MTNDRTDLLSLKRVQMKRIAEYRDSLRVSPNLYWLFFEITDQCNLFCKHCGSNCTAVGEKLSPEDIGLVLDSLTGSKHKPMICLTGGEPMMHPLFFEIANCVKHKGFDWGMTTNATLIDEKSAEKLRQAGLATVSVSLDGMEESHDGLRGRNGAWKLAVRGIRALQKVGIDPQVTTVVNKRNIGELDCLYRALNEMGVTSWRPINVEPIGRACESHDLLLDMEQIAYLLSYIRDKRFDPDCKMEVTFGCSHYLGIKTERMVRDNYFLCGAGILIAGIRSNGDICACLDIEDRPELVQGNIYSDNFAKVWTERFGIFRQDRTSKSTKCIGCPERSICAGDSAHTWDYEKNEPLLCYSDFADAINEQMQG